MATPLNILVVEDHDALRAVTVEVLRMQGHAVMEAASAEALDELSPERRFDVAVLDLNLPGEDGFSLAARLRKACPGIGIVMVTVRHALDDKLTAYQQLDGRPVALATSRPMVSAITLSDNTII